MNASFIKTVPLALLLLIIQVVILNRIHLFGCATPLLLVYVIITLPQNTPRWGSLLLGFFMGLISDIFTNTPGVATVTLTFIAFIQPVFLLSFLPQDFPEDVHPSLQSLGMGKYLTYSLVLTFLYCALYFFLENFGFSHGLWLLLNIVCSTALTYIFILTLENIRRV